MAKKCVYCGVSEDASDEEKQAKMLKFEVGHVFAPPEEDDEQFQEEKEKWGDK
jgi:hypothetical protein